MVKADVPAAQIKPDEVRIKSSNNQLQVECSKASPDRKVFLTVRVPAKAFLSMETGENSIQITEPADQIILGFSSSELLKLTVPESSALDMKEARSAVERRQLGPLGNARIGMSGRQVGSGPPYVKVNAPKALVVVSRGFIEPPPRPPTLDYITLY